MSSLKDTASLTARLEAHARLHEQFYPSDEEQAQWADDLREAIDAIRERDELAQQRGDLAARVVELQTSLLRIADAARESPYRAANAWDDALAKLIARSVEFETLSEEDIANAVNAAAATVGPLSVAMSFTARAERDEGPAI